MFSNDDDHKGHHHHDGECCHHDHGHEHEHNHGATSQPIRYEHPKVGRNEMCPCGSGKKFKKCCERESP